MFTVSCSYSMFTARIFSSLRASFTVVCRRAWSYIHAVAYAVGHSEIERETDALFADRIPSLRTLWLGKSVNKLSTPATAPSAPSVGALEAKSTPLRPSGVPDHPLQGGGLSTPVVVPAFTEAATRPDRSRAEANATRSRMHREGINSEHCSKVNVPANDKNLQQCKQLLPTGRACINLYQRTKKKKMCKSCHERYKSADLSSSCASSVCSLSGRSYSECSDSFSESSITSEQSAAPDIRMMRIYTRGRRGHTEETPASHVPIAAAALSPLVLLLNREHRGIALWSLLCVGALFLNASTVLPDGGSRRDPRLNETYSNLLDGDLLPYTKDEMLYLGHGGYITKPVNWDILLWLRAHKRVKTTKNNAKAVLAYVLSQYPETPLEIARDTSAYFIQELQQDEIYFDHHTVLNEQGAPPSYPDGHWRPN